MENCKKMRFSKKNIVNSLFWETSALEMKWQVIRHKIQKTRMIYLLREKKSEHFCMTEKKFKFFYTP